MKTQKETVKATAPNGSESKVYIGLGKVQCELKSLDIEQTRGTYKNVNSVVVLEDERKFGFYLSVYLGRIEIELGKHYDWGGSFYNVVLEKYKAITDIFEI